MPEADQRDDVRELVIQGYRIIYLVTTEEVQILTVAYGSRDLVAKELKPWDAG